MKTLPHNLEAEQAMLGAVLLDQEAFGRALETGLEPADFYRTAHQSIFQAMADLYYDSEPIDLMSLAEKLNRGISLSDRLTVDLSQIGGPAYLAELSDAVGTPANSNHYAQIIKGLAVKRNLILVGQNIAGADYGPMTAAEALDSAETAVMALRDGRRNGTGRTLGGAALREVLDALEDRATSGIAAGLPSGLMDLDELTAGWQPSDLIVIAGRPGMGKTALAITTALHAARRGVGMALFSLEMSYEQIALRALAQEAVVDVHKLRTGRGLDAQWSKIADGATRINGLPIHIDDQAGLSVLDIKARCRRIRGRLEAGGAHLGLIVVDYIQLMSGTGDNREQEISGISRGLKAMAKEFNVPVIALSQLNRKLEDRTDKRPRLADLRESGAIEQDADVIVFVYRDEIYRETQDNRGTAELLVSKQRNGPTGMVKCAFVEWFAGFRDLAR